jgi:hypothetical protein
MRFKHVLNDRSKSGLYSGLQINRRFLFQHRLFQALAAFLIWININLYLEIIKVNLMLELDFLHLFEVVFFWIASKKLLIILEFPK